MNSYVFINNWYTARNIYELRIKSAISWLFIPIFLAIEYYVYRKYWYNTVVHELLTNDDLVFYLERNEFIYNKHEFVKFDVIEPTTYYDQKPIREATDEIRGEFAKSLCDIIAQKSPIPIEDSISIITEIESRTAQKLGETYRAKLYFVYLRFNRYPKMLETLKGFFVWCIILIICLSIYGFSLLF